MPEWLCPRFQAGLEQLTSQHSSFCWYFGAILSCPLLLPSSLGVVGRGLPSAIRGLPEGCCWTSPSSYTTGYTRENGTPHPSYVIQIPNIPDTHSTAHKHTTPPTVNHTHIPNTADTHNISHTHNHTLIPTIPHTYTSHTPCKHTPPFNTHITYHMLDTYHRC